MKKIIIKILCVSMTIASLGTYNFREVNASNKITYEPEEYDGLPSLLQEDETLRDDSSKTFMLSDHSSQMILYSEPVHYIDEDGKYQEYDNELIEYNESKESSELDQDMLIVKLNTTDNVFENNVTKDDELINEEISEDILSESGEATDLEEVIIEEDDTPDEIQQRSNEDLLASIPQLDNNIDGYINRTSDLKVMFSRYTHRNNIGAISNGKHILVWGIANYDHKNEAKIEERKIDNDPITSIMTKSHGRILYPDVYKNTDVHYTVGPEKIKESIIIKDQTDKYQYSFFYHSDTLVLKKNEAGEIEALDKESGETIYRIPKPFMYDEEGRYCDDVSYTLEGEDGRYIITVICDEKWMNDKDRKYPVTIDPEIRTATTRNAINTTFVTSSRPTTNHSNKLELLVGKESSEYGNCRTLVKFTLPSLNRGDMIVNAVMHLFTYNRGFYSSTTPDLPVYANMITSSWNMSTVTWNTCPSFDSTVLDYDHIKRSDTPGNYAYRKTFEITSAVKGWYEGSIANNGIMLKSYNENGSYAATGVKGYFWPERYNTVSDAYPFISLVYRNNKGMEDYWDFLDLSSGSAGNVHVNTYSGNLVISHTDASAAGKIMPAAVTHYYNGYQANSNISYIGPYIGKGWKLNVQQTLRPSSDYGLTGDSASTFPYVYMDEDGTEHYFRLTDGKYLDEDGLNLELKVISGGYEIRDRSDTKLVFNSNGCITSLTDVNNNSITYHYRSGTNILSSITDSSNQMITLSSDSNGYLTSVTDPAGRTVSYGYTDGYLTSITYPDGKITTYSYDEDGAVTRSQSYDGISLNYTYTSLSKGKRVSSVTEKAGTTNGQTIRLDYSEYNLTRLITRGIDSIIDTSDDVTSVLQFDDAGRLTGTYAKTNNKDLGASTIDMTASKVDDTGSNISKLNRVAKTASLSKTVNNLIVNHNCESTTSWSSSSSVAESTFSFDSVNSEHYNGNRSFRISVTSSSPKARARCYQDISTAYIRPDTTYTLSAYVKTDNIVPVNNADGAGACLIVYMNAPSMPISSDPEAADTVSEYITGTTDTAIDDGWRRISVTFTTPSDINYIRVNPTVRGAKGTAYFDCIQLEEGNVCNPYNIIENGSMERVSSNVPVSWTRAGTSSNDITNTSIKRSGSRSIVMTGDPNGLKEFDQIIPVTGKEEDTYVVSGWAYGKGMKKDDLSRLFQVGVRIIYSDGSTTWKNALNFNTSLTGWQYGAKSFDLSDYTDQVKTPQSIVITCRCYRQANSTYFDDIQLIKKKVYIPEYDDDGKLISDNEGNRLTYTGNDVATSTDKTGIVASYIYDSNHQVTSKSLSSGITESYSYDSHGNTTSTIITGGNSSILTESVYSSDGRYKIKDKDADGKEISYSYDTVKGLLQSVTNQNSHTISYGYRSSDDLLTTISDGTSTVTATYDTNKRITSISHDTMTYSFIYNSFGEIVTTRAGGNTISTNSYLPYNGDLSSVIYSNGYSESCSYDEYGNVIQYKENNTISEDDVYDSLGNIIKLIDHRNNREYRYYYTVSNELSRMAVFELGNYRLEDHMVYLKEYGTDSEGRADADYTSIGNYSQKVKLEYDTTTGLVSRQNIGNRSVSYIYDGLQRMTSKSLNTSTPVNISYTYKNSQRGNNYTTGKIATETIGGKTYSYEYDDAGNITSITSSDGRIDYFYDSQSQLIRENNGVLNKTIIYTYDTRGNILNVKEYTLTNGTPAVLSDNKQYSYRTSGWIDQLISYDGTSISYDSAGNPTSYRGYTLGWNGRKLSSLTGNGKNITYSYGSDGIRQSKTVNGDVITYDYAGSQLIHEGHNTYDLYFTYDMNGNLTKITKKSGNNTNEYFVAVNVRGDVDSIYNSAGILQARYIYDSWGNTIRIVNSSGNIITDSNHIARLNTFRYRGYYCDVETDFYYLESRYYDPQIKRFTSADSINNIGLSSNFASFNCYSYCDNSSVNNIDSYGQFAISAIVLKGAIGFGIGAAAKICYGIATREKTTPTDLMLDFVIGGWSGLMSGTGCNALFSAVSCGLMEGLTTWLKTKSDTKAIGAGMQSTLLALFNPLSHINVDNFGLLDYSLFSSFFMNPVGYCEDFVTNKIIEKQSVRGPQENTNSTQTSNKPYWTDERMKEVERKVSFVC